MDFRKEWFRDRILIHLDESDPILFDEFLQRDNNSILHQFDDYLNKQTDEEEDLWNQVLVVYKTFFSKSVEEEVEVKEEVSEEQFSTLLGEEDKKRDKKHRKKKKSKKSKTAKIENDDITVDFKEIRDKPEILDDFDETENTQKKIVSREGRISPSTVMENLQPYDQTRKPSSSSYVIVKKKIHKVVQVPQIQGYFGFIPESEVQPAAHFVYFIKKLNAPIPKCDDMQEAYSKMPTYLIVYNLTDNVLENLENILTYVFIPLFRNRIPEYNNQKTIEVDYDNLSDISLELDEDMLQRRPSYYYERKCENGSDLLEEEFEKLCENHTFSDQIKQFISPDIAHYNLKFIKNLQKLTNIVKWARHELETELKLPIPDVFRNNGWKTQENEEIVKYVKETVELWICIINSEIAFASNDDHVMDKDFMNEFVHWRQIEARLNSIVDETESEIINIIVEKLKEIPDISLYSDFKEKKFQLSSYQADAKENVEVLRTLRYFFKVLDNDDFETVTRELDPLLKSLKSIWMLSKYYCREKNMQRILNNIRSILCSRVKEKFNVKILFKCTSENIEKQLENAAQMLSTWKRAYLEIRAQIESNRDYFIRRWEFDKQKLFAETDYITTVIQDIENVLKVIQHYRDLFVSKFTKFTENTNEYKNLQQKVLNLTKPIENVDFDIYLEIFHDEWMEILESFQKDLTDADQYLKIFIIKVFSQIRSVSVGVQIVKDFCRINTRPTIHDSIPYMCNKILTSFRKKIEATDSMFEKNKKVDVGFKICDSIVWTENIINKIKEKIDSFLAVDCLHTNEQFEKVVKHFEDLKLKVQSYKEAIYNQWSSKVSSLITDVLKQNIVEIEEADKILDLKKLTERKRCSTIELTDSERISIESNKDVKTDFSLGSLALTLNWIARSKISAENYIRTQQFEKLKKIEQAHKVSWLEFVDNSLLLEKGFKFKLKIKKEIFDIATEAENLQKFNFRLCDKIREFLVIRSDLFRYVENIDKIVNKYNDIIMNLQPHKILMLKEYLLESEMLIQPGLTLYTWKSSVLDEYITNASSKLKQLSCLLYQVDEIFKKLNYLLVEIENINFLPIEKINAKKIKCFDFFQRIDELQVKEVNKCLNTYEKISLTLIQLESLVLCTNTGRSEYMTYCYNEYSEKILKALIRSVSNSMSDLETLFIGKSCKRFVMRAYLDEKEIKLDTSCGELHKLVRIEMIRIFCRLKYLKCWEPKSCIIGRQSSSEFYFRLIENQSIKESCVKLLRSLQDLCDCVNLALNEWLTYSVLWIHDKDFTIELFTLEYPELTDYEHRFDFYSYICSKIEQENTIINVNCIDIDMRELIEQLKNHCLEWKNKLSVQLATDTRLKIVNLATTVDKLNCSLDCEIINIENLTRALFTVSEIQKIIFDMEIEFYKIQEHHHELKMQNFDVSEKDMQDFENFKLQWQKLYDKSLYKKFVLEPVKVYATAQVTRKINEFVGKCEIFTSTLEKEFLNFEILDIDMRMNSMSTFSKQFDNLYTEYNEVEFMRNCFEISSCDLSVFISAQDKFETLRAKCEVKTENRDVWVIKEEDANK